MATPEPQEAPDFDGFADKHEGTPEGDSANWETEIQREGAHCQCNRGAEAVGKSL
jgi:hypothetical protein